MVSPDIRIGVSSDPGNEALKRDDAFFRDMLGRYGFKDFISFEKGIKRGGVELMTKGVAALIEYGYPRPTHLYRALPESPEKRKLGLTLLESGIIPLESQAAQESSRYVEQELEEREGLKDLFLSGMPPEVLGQIMTVELFRDITDEKKIEELRSWTSEALLAPYIGLMEGERRMVELSPIEMLDRIPERIFSHPNVLKYNLVANYFQARFLGMITDLGVEGAIEEIEQTVIQTEDEDKRRFLQEILDDCWEIVTRPQKGEFKQTIIVNEQLRHFPSAEQQAAAYYAETAECRLFVSPPGNGKTGAAYYFLENTDAQRVVVFAPAKGRETWQIEDQVLFKNPGNVFLVNKASDLRSSQIAEKKYVVIGHELLGDTENNPQLLKDLKDVLLDKLGADAAAIDEIDDFSNPNAVSTGAIRELIEGIRDNYAKKTGKERNATPVLGLTATPFKTGLHDLNVPLAILYPDRFAATATESTPTKKTFSDSCLNRPDLAYLTLTGERRMYRWEAAGLQEQRCEPVFVELSSFEEYLYDFIDRQVGVDALNKIRILENALLNPLLIKAEVRHLANGKIGQIDIDEVTGHVRDILLQWKVMREITIPTSDDDYLSADKLVDLGWGDMVLNSFFSHALENGIDTLVEEMTRNTNDPQLQDLRLFWQSREISSKYKALKEKVEDTLAWKEGEDGVLERKKLFIVSPSKRQGRTSDVMQRTIINEDGQRDNLYANYELEEINDTKLFTLIQKWAAPYCKEEDILLIDGSVPIGRRRDRVINRWRHDPDAAVLVATLESIYQSRSFMITRTIDGLGRRIAGVRLSLLNPPWHGQQEEQTTGRSIRQGQLVPAENEVFVTDNTIEQGKFEVVRFTRLLYRMALAGVRLNREDQEFYNTKKKGEKIVRFREASHYLRNALRMVRGAGEEGIEHFLESQLEREEITNGLKIAREFFDNGNDAYKISGYNADFVTHFIKSSMASDSRILSLGAGTLLLQRKLQRGIDNVDINPYMMQAGWELASIYGGRTITAKASKLDLEAFPDASYDLVDSAFALHWSALGDVKTNNVNSSNRVAILRQIHRTLRSDGTLMLTLPEGAFDNEQLTRFIDALEAHFGFTVDRSFSGRSFAVNKAGLQKRLGWSIVAKKTGEVNLEGLLLQDLGFSYERKRWEKDGRDRKEEKGETNDSEGDYPNPELRLSFDAYGVVSLDNQVHYIPFQKEQNTVDGEQITDADQNAAVDGVLREAVVFQVEAPTREEAIAYLKGTTDKDYRIFRNQIIRFVQKEANLSWEDAEHFCADVIIRMVKQGKVPTNRADARSWILKDLKRKQYV